jgi:uncharacterized membrane protein YhaH (DUF805 family)
MDFVAAVKTSLMKWADFRGIASRAEFWWFQLFLVLANFALLSLGIFISIALPDAGPPITGIALIALWVLALVPTTALSVRRLRDGGFPRGLIFIALIPFGGLGLLVMYLMPTKPGQMGGNSAELTPTEATVVPNNNAEQAAAASQLERLTALHASGTINDQQFELAKKKLEGRSN